jgi:hypothetical protein
MFTEIGPLLNGRGPTALTSLDLNSDETLDLVSTNPNDNSVSVFLNLGNRKFSEASDLQVGTCPGTLVPLADGVHRLAVGDFGGCVDGKGGGLTLIGFQGGMAIVDESTSLGRGVASLASADFNGDLLPDIAVALYDENELVVLLTP